MEQFKSINDYFVQELKGLQTKDEVRAYIVSIFIKYKSSDDDFSKQSLTIEYGTAKNNQDFSRFQNLGDYIFFTNALHPESLNGASKEYYYSLAQMSYYFCYRKIKWRLYEELADQFVDLSENTRRIIRKF